MYKLIYTPQARRDLNAIRKYIAWRSGTRSTGLDFVKKLREKCKELSTIKGKVGTSRLELGQSLRSQPFGNYVILFRYEQDSFEVVSIIEGHRDIEAMFSDDE